MPYYVLAPALCWAFVAALDRGWYRPWLRYVVPTATAIGLMPALAISRGFLAAQGLPQDHLVPLSALMSAALVVSGAFRFNPRAAALAAVSGVVPFAWSVAVLRVDPALTAVCAMILAMLGVLSAWLAGATGAVVRAEVARATLGRFLPDTVLTGAWEDPVAALTVPRELEATVLVTDLRGFTAWSERRPAAEVLGRLNDLQGALADIVRAHGGTVDKFMGDGMLAVFGAPEPLPDHAARAVAAARRMLREVDGSELRLGLGIHTGPVIAGCLGSAARLEFTVLGDTVNTASRLEALTKDLGVSAVVSEATARASGATLRPLSRVAVRGREAALDVLALDP